MVVLVYSVRRGRPRPPLATVGIALQLGAPDRAQGAFLLFGTNLFAIVLSAMVMMLASGFVPPEIRPIARGRVRAGIVVSVLALGAVAVPLTVHTREVVADQNFARQTIGAIQDWDPAGRIVNLQVDSTPKGGIVDLVRPRRSLIASSAGAAMYSLVTVSSRLGFTVAGWSPSNET